MGVTASSGPLGTYGQAQLDGNTEAGPSFWAYGDMIMDPRPPFRFQPGGNGPILGWPMNGASQLIDQVPATASATNILNASPISYGVPILLTGVAASAGIVPNCQVVNAATGQLVKGLVGLDVCAARSFAGTFAAGNALFTPTTQVVPLIGLQAGDAVALTGSPAPFVDGNTYYVNSLGINFMTLSATRPTPGNPEGTPVVIPTAGATTTVNVAAPNLSAPFTPYQPHIMFSGAGRARYWNPNWALSRGLVLTTTGNDSAGLITVNGFDAYGYPLTWRGSPAAAGANQIPKAFKYVQSILGTGTLGSTTVSLGTTDVFGVPLRVDMASQLQVNFGLAALPPLIAPGAIGLVTADVNPPGVQGAGDVRGTIAPGASNGSSRLVVYWSCSPVAMAQGTVGLLGHTPS